MLKALSDEEMNRIKEMYREMLGRDLSPDEQRYLGLSSIGVSIHELELGDAVMNRQTLKLVGRD